MEQRTASPHGHGPAPGGAPGPREPPRTAGLHGPGEGKAAADTRTLVPWRCENCPSFLPKFPQEKQFWLPCSRYWPGAPSDLTPRSYGFMSKPFNILINTNLHKISFPFE